MGFKSAQVSVGTTTVATLVATIPAAVPDSDGVLVYASAAGSFIGGSTVTTANGFPLPATQVISVPTTGADSGLKLYCISSSTATITVSVLYPG